MEKQLKFKFDNTPMEATVAGFDEGIATTIIPTEVNGYKVTSIGDEAFEGCTSLTEIVIPDSVTDIGYYAFDDCTSLTTVTMPDSVTSIGGHAFSYCTSLESITIPDSVTSIGDWAFTGCNSLKSINVSENNQNYCSENGILFNKDKTELIQYPIGKTDTSYEIPDSVTIIGDSAFSHCESLESITIPDSVTSIGDNAFKDCDSLTSITIPNSVTSIGEYTFSYCNSLTSITIPDSVTSIGSGAFFNCKSLTTVTIPDSVTSIGDWAFHGCDKSERLSSVPNNVDGYAEMRNKLQQSKTNNKAKSKQRVTTTNEFLGIQSDSKELNDVQLKEL